MTSRFKIQDAYSKGLKAAAKLPRRVRESPSAYRSEIDAVVRAFRDKEDDKHQTLLGADWADSWIRGDYGQDYRWGLETALGWGPYRYAVYEYRGDGVYNSPVSPLYDNPTEARRWIQKNLSRDDAYHGGSQGRGYVVRQTAKEKNPTNRIRNGALEFRTKSHRDQVAQLLRRHPQSFGSRVFEQDSRSRSAGRSKKSPAYLIVAPGVGQDELSRWWQRAVEADHGRKRNPQTKDVTVSAETKKAAQKMHQALAAAGYELSPIEGDKGRSRGAYSVKPYYRFTITGGAESNAEAEGAAAIAALLVGEKYTTNAKAELEWLGRQYPEAYRKLRK